MVGEAVRASLRSDNSFSTLSEEVVMRILLRAADTEATTSTVGAEGATALILVIGAEAGVLLAYAAQQYFTS